MPKPEKTNFADSMTERAVSRIPEDLNQMGINDYIATLSNLQSAGMAISDDSDRFEDESKKIGMYSYLRDQFDVNVIGDVQKVLADAEVPPNVVSLWVEEGLAVNPREYDAIAIGYPKQREELASARAKFLAEVSGKYGN